MPATGLKIVETGACLPWCSIYSSFQNILKTSGHRGYEFLEFWCWNLVPFLPDIGFQLTGHDGASGTCSHIASFLHDRALVGLCLPTVLSGSIPGPI